MLAMPALIQEWKEVSYLQLLYLGFNANTKYRKDMDVDGRSGQNRWKSFVAGAEVAASRIVQYYVGCIRRGVKHHIVVYIMCYILYENELFPDHFLGVLSFKIFLLMLSSPGVG